MFRIDRRTFNLSALAAPLVVTSALRGEDAPSKKITLGFIGVGTMGLSHVHSFLNMADVQIVAVSDVAAERRDNARKTVDAFYSKKKSKSDCKAYNDFRERGA